MWSNFNEGKVILHVTSVSYFNLRTSYKPSFSREISTRLYKWLYKSFKNFFIG